MSKNYIEGKSYKSRDFSTSSLKTGEYENCKFTGCNFSVADLSGINFVDCDFSGCDFSMAKVNDTVFREVRFNDCKVLGVQFKDCNRFLFSVEFDTCMLNLSVFFKMNLKNVEFSNCTIHEADFTESDLTGISFDNCDLSDAIFENTNLERADFTTAYNYIFDPDLNRIKKAKFAVPGLAGLLSKYDIIIE